MSGETGENNTKKPDAQDSRYSNPSSRSMWFYYGLLSGSLLMVGGIAGNKFFRLSRSLQWSLLRFSASVTGMYLTLYSIQRLYNRSRACISEEAENVDTNFKDARAPEKFDKSITINLLRVTECPEVVSTVEDNIVENAFDDSVDETAEVLSNSVADIEVKFEEINISEVSTNQPEPKETIVLKCEGTKCMLSEVEEDCTITQDFISGDTKDAEVVKNDSIIGDNNKDKMEYVSTKDIAFKSTGTDESVENINIVASVFCEKYIGGSSQDSNINFPVDMNRFVENVYNETVVCLEEYNVKEPNIENIIASDINISDLIASDDLTTDRLDEDMRTNEIIKKDTKETEIPKSVVEKDVTNKNIVVGDVLTECKFDKDFMTIIDEEAKISEKNDFIDNLLTDDVIKSKLSEERKIRESAIINEDEREMTEYDNIVQHTITTIEKDMDVEIVEIATKEINIECPRANDCVTEITLGAMTNEDSNDISIEEFASNDISIEHNKASDDITFIQETDGRETLKRNTSIENTVVEDVVADSKLYKEVMATYEKGMVKEDRIEEIAAKNKNIEEQLAEDDENKHKLKKEIKENVFNIENVIEEKLEGTANDIFETPVAGVDVDDRNTIKKMNENESCEMVFEKVKSEEVATSMDLSFGNTTPEKDENQEKFSMKIRKNDLEECTTKESEIDIISKGIDIEDQEIDNGIIEEKLNKNNLEVDILQDDIIMKVKTKEVIAKNSSIDITLIEHEVFNRDLSENIGVSRLIEENCINEERTDDDNAIKCIEDDVIIVKETFYKSLPQEQLEKNMLFQNSVTADEIMTKIIDDEISASDIDNPCIIVHQTTLIKDTETQNENEVEAKTDEQNVNEALRTEFNPVMLLTEQYPKLSESQLLSNSTDELRFISPVTNSGVSVFFRKSNKPRLAAQFSVASAESATDKECVETSVESVYSTIESCSEQLSKPIGDKVFKGEHFPTGTDTAITTTNIQSSEIFTSFKDTISQQQSNNAIDASNKKGTHSSDSVTILPTRETLHFSGSNVWSTTSKYSIRLSSDINIVVDPNNCQSTGTSNCSVVFQTEQTCDAILPTGQSSSDSERVIVPFSQLVHVPDISSTDRHLKLPDTTTTCKDSPPVISAKAVSIPIQFEKQSENIYDTPVNPLPKPIGSPDKSSRLPHKTSEAKCASFEGHSLRSPTYDRHSSSSSDFDSSLRLNVRSPVGGSEYRRSVSRISGSQQSRRSIGRRINPRSEPLAAASVDDIFSHAADSPWTSCDDISQAVDPSKDVFSLARNSPWSSCGDVSSQTRQSKRTSDGDVFSNAHNSPWVSGSGTVFHPGPSRKQRSPSRSRHSRVGSGSRPRVRHSQSPTGCVELPAEISRTRNLTSP